MPHNGQVRRVLHSIFELQLKLSMLALVAMMIIIVADVFMRYTFNAPIPGTYDLVGILLAIMVFFGLAKVISERAEITIDIVDNLVPPVVVRLLKIIASLIALGVLLFVFWSMIGPMISAQRYGDRSLELNLPVWLTWALSLVGLAGAILAAFMAVFSSGKTEISDERGTDL